LQEHRLKCDYIPEENCQKVEKKYCYKQETVEMVEVCDKKLATEYL
jgi:hypothetical protein